MYRWPGTIQNCDRLRASWNIVYSVLHIIMVVKFNRFTRVSDRKFIPSVFLLRRFTNIVCS